MLIADLQFGSALPECCVFVASAPELQTINAGVVYAMNLCIPGGIYAEKIEKPSLVHRSAIKVDYNISIGGSYGNNEL
jgi:hypothetical protein